MRFLKISYRVNTGTVPCVFRRGYRTVTVFPCLALVNTEPQGMYIVGTLPVIIGIDYVKTPFDTVQCLFHSVTAR